MTTVEMAAHLGCHRDTIVKKWTFLQKGTHYKKGPHRNSPKIWNVSAVEAAVRERGHIIFPDLGGQG